MRYSIAASGLLGLVAAAPQLINIEAALAVPTPTILGPKVEETKPAAVSYNPSVAASSAAAIVKNEGAIEKRDYYIHNVTSAPFIITDEATKKKRNACDPQPVGHGPPVDPDTAAAFSGSAELSRIARAAGTPDGYTQSFVDQAGSSQQIGYLTYRTPTTYDVQGCADACDSEKYCRGFNIYFERDPSVDPGSGCPNPASTNNIKCSLYGYPVALNAATNKGQYRQDFQIVIAGSNGYSKTNKALPTVDGFKTPTSLPGAINAPLDNGYDTYNGMRLFNDNPFDPALCAAACKAQTEYDVAHPASDGTYKPCNFFSTYILEKNGVPLGTYCSLYTRSWDPSYATNTGYYYGDDKYDVVSAGSYEVTTPIPVPSPKANSPTCAATGTQLGFPCGSGSVSVKGVLQVLDAGTSAVLGYLNTNPAQSGGYMYNLDTKANALIVKATYTSPNCAATTITDLALEMQNAQSTANGAYIGLVGGSGGYAKMGSGHVDYAYTGQVSYVGPDSTAQGVTTGATALGYNGPAEASIWNLDVACGGLTATWTNNDQTQITTTMFLDYSLCSSGCILQGGDQAKFQARYSGERLQTVTVKFVPNSS